MVRATEGLQPWRRVFHAASGLALAWLPWALGFRLRELLVLLAAGFALLVLADLARLRCPSLNRLVFRLLRPFITPPEAERFASSTWYALGVLLTYLLFPLAVAIPSILVLALADPAASVVGQTVGRFRVGKGTLAGAAAFFAVAALVLLTTVWSGAGMARVAVVTAAVVTGVELLPLGVDDNLTVPVATASALSLFAVVL